MTYVNSTKNKLALSGWLLKNNTEEFYTSLKLQKFLFFYEVLRESEGQESDLHSLQGWKDGPVFGTVYGDYTYRLEYFINESEKAFKENFSDINESLAKLSSFVISIMNKSDLSEYSHMFNLWKAKENSINNGVKKVSLDKEDFNKNDRRILDELKGMYTEEFIDSVSIIKINSKVFILDKSKTETLTEENKNTLEVLSSHTELINPVYIDIEDGVLMVD